MKFQLEERKQDIISGNDDLEFVFSIKNLPAKMGVSSFKKETDYFSDLNFFISKGSGMIQISPLIPLEILYEDGHGAGTTGKIWQEHHQMFCEFISDFKPLKILEIGGGHSNLSKLYLKSEPVIESWTIMEPGNKQPEHSKDKRINFVNEFFDSSYPDKNEKIDCIVNSHLFEHLYNPLSFLNDVKKSLTTDGLVLMSVPNMDFMLKHKHANTIMFEHTYFASEDFIKYMFLKEGFTLEKKIKFKNHSVFYAFKKTNKTFKVSYPDKYHENFLLITEYKNYLNKISSEISKTISEDNFDNFYLFGAHIFSQILLSLGIEEKKITCVLDNDPNKQGKRLYGTSLKVESPDFIESDRNSLIILNAGNYNEEIKRQLLKVNNKLQFLIN